MPLRNSSYDALQAGLRQRPKSWLVTGAAGFIGSHLVHSLLKLDQKVIGFDNFSTGKRANLAEIEGELAAQIRKNFQLIEGDLQNLELCRRACAGADFVLHQAALCSVPASIANPVAAHASNVTGFLHILTAAREAKVQRLVYASSCAVYGDLSNLPCLPCLHVRYGPSHLQRDPIELEHARNRMLAEGAGEGDCLTPSQNTWTNSMPQCSRGITDFLRLVCAISMYSDRARIPMARTPL